MANPLKCDICSKPATVHLTQILDNKVHKVDLCEECAQAKGVTDPSGFSLADLLLKASLNPDTTPEGVAQPGHVRGHTVRAMRILAERLQEARPVRVPGLLRRLQGAPRPDARRDAQGDGPFGQGSAEGPGEEVALRQAHKARGRPRRGDQGGALRGRCTLPR